MTCPVCGLPGCSFIRWALEPVDTDPLPPQGDPE